MEREHAGGLKVFPSAQIGSELAGLLCAPALLVGSSPYRKLQRWEVSCLQNFHSAIYCGWLSRYSLPAGKTLVCLESVPPRCELTAVIRTCFEQRRSIPSLVSFSDFKRQIQLSDNTDTRGSSQHVPLLPFISPCEMGCF